MKGKIWVSKGILGFVYVLEKVEASTVDGWEGVWPPARQTAWTWSPMGKLAKSCGAGREVFLFSGVSVFRRFAGGSTGSGCPSSAAGRSQYQSFTEGKNGI